MKPLTTRAPGNGTNATISARTKPSARHPSVDITAIWIVRSSAALNSDDDSSAE